jgi:hypothetical protein
MSIGVFLMVLYAAVVHAMWNALVKSDEDRLGLIRVMFLTQFAFSLSLDRTLPAFKGKGLIPAESWSGW